MLRYKFDPVNSKKLGDAEKIMDLPRRGHSTRAVAFSPDGKHLFVSVGSQSNIDIESDSRRAAVTICDPDGKNARLYGTGLRNPVDIALEPKTGVLYTSVNERDGLGDDLPPDYFTSVKDGGFYGWPYSYIGKNVDPRVNPQKPELVAKAIIPDVLLGAHRAPLQFAFYTGKQFPSKYDGGVFLCEHGSWNRSTARGLPGGVHSIQGWEAVGRSGAVYDGAGAGSYEGKCEWAAGGSDGGAGWVVAGFR